MRVNKTLTPSPSVYRWAGLPAEAFDQATIDALLAP